MDSAILHQRHHQTTRRTLNSERGCNGSVGTTKQRRGRSRTTRYSNHKYIYDSPAQSVADTEDGSKSDTSDKSHTVSRYAPSKQQKGKGNDALHNRFLYSASAGTTDDGSKSEASDKRSRTSGRSRRSAASRYAPHKHSKAHASQITEPTADETPDLSTKGSAKMEFPSYTSYSTWDTEFPWTTSVCSGGLGSPAGENRQRIIIKATPSTERMLKERLDRTDSDSDADADEDSNDDDDSANKVEGDAIRVKTSVFSCSMRPAPLSNSSNDSAPFFKDLLDSMFDWCPAKPVEEKENEECSKNVQRRLSDKIALLDRYSIDE